MTTIVYHVRKKLQPKVKGVLSRLSRHPEGSIGTLCGAEVTAYDVSISTPALDLITKDGERHYVACTKCQNLQGEKL